MNTSLDIRPPAVAGTFYPGTAAELGREVQRLLAQAAKPGSAGDGAIKALIVPHAGYVYSGPIAASAYAMLAAQRHSLRRVVLLGPCHRVATRGLALPAARAFATPLGDIDIDTELENLLIDLPQVHSDEAAHQLEHSLEVQLPFLQQSLERFTLLPLAVGDATGEQVAEVLERVWGGPETLIVISSDLSHYHAYAEARQRDSGTVDQVLRLQPLTSFEQACGALPVNGLILCAQRRGLKPRLVDLRNSGDTAGDRARVVGYAAFVLEPAPAATAAAALGATLLALARQAIAADLGLTTPAQPAATSTALHEPGACFVTLTRLGQLRGCIGSLEARRRLIDDVRANACAAASRDPRFPPVTAAELPGLRLEVSLLTQPEPMQFASEADALAQLRPGVDGIIFEAPGHRSTFLPQVWQSLPTAADFLTQLKLKAGLPASFWSPEVKLWRYRVQKWAESDGS